MDVFKCHGVSEPTDIEMTIFDDKERRTILTFENLQKFDIVCFSKFLNNE